MENNCDLLIKHLKFNFEQIKAIISQKDIRYADFKIICTRIKESNEFTNDDIKYFIEIIVNFMENKNLKIFEKCISCIEKIISLNLFEFNYFPNFTINVLNNLLDKSSQNNDAANFKILNLCLVLYTNRQFNPKGSNFQLIIRICLFIILTSTNPSCQNIAKITLIQIMDYFLVNCNDSFLNLGNILYNSNEDREEINMSTKFINMDFMNRYLTHCVDIVVLSFDYQKNNSISFLCKFINNYNLDSESNILEENINNLFEINFNENTKNEIGYLRGRYGWCYYCRKSANYYSSVLKFPFCSQFCEESTHNIGIYNKPIETDNVKEDFISIFKYLSILSIKDIKDNKKVEKINLKLREFCLELMHKMLITSGKHFRKNNEMIEVIRGYTIDSLVKNSLSNDVNNCKISLALFVSLIKYFRQNLKDKIDIFIDKVLIYILESENFSYEFKEIIIDTLRLFNESSDFLIELFSNFDCEINRINILKELLNLFCKIIQKLYFKPKYEKTFLGNEPSLLRMKCFNFLIDFVKKLDKFVEERIPRNICEINSNLQNNSNIDESETINYNQLKEKISQNRKIKSIIEQGVEKFNIKPSKGIDFLRINEILPSVEVFNNLKSKLHKNESNFITYQILYDKNFISSCEYEEFVSKEISKFLKNNKDLKKLKVGEYLCSNENLNKKCLYDYIELFNFKNLHILEAMRIFFSDFYLIGEGQIVDRIMQHFGQKYHKDNPSLFKNPDIGYYLSFSIIMLQTDLHRPEIVVKMDVDTFCHRVIQLTKSEMKIEFLQDIYNNILNEPIKLAGIQDQFGIVKNKKVRNKENEEILKNTIMEFKNKESSVLFFTKMDNYHVRNLLESCWPSFLGIFSVYNFNYKLVYLMR